MPILKANGHTCELDASGFVSDSTQWNEEVARELARRESMPELTAEHWQVIHYLRSYYLRHGSIPLERQLCRDTGFTPEKITELFLVKSFHHQS